VTCINVLIIVQSCKYLVHDTIFLYFFNFEDLMADICAMYSSQRYFIVMMCVKPVRLLHTISS
jgi:hypothetical protein